MASILVTEDSKAVQAGVRGLLEDVHRVIQTSDEESHWAQAFSQDTQDYKQLTHLPRGAVERTPTEQDLFPPRRALWDSFRFLLTQEDFSLWLAPAGDCEFFQSHQC